MKKEMRRVYHDTLESLLENNKKVVMLDADLTNCVQTGDLYAKYPNQCINCGISEANMLSTAAGLSLSGLTPFAQTFVPFITRRALDQFYMSICYSHTNVFLYGSEPGIYSQANGGTHCSVEDFSILRALPYINVCAPSDPTSFEWIMNEYVNNPKPIYVRAPRAALPILYKDVSSLQFGKGQYLYKGERIAIITIGDRVHKAMEAREELLKDGINVSVVDLMFVKPYDQQLILDVIKNHDQIITFENHNIYGGIGDIIASEIATSDYSCKLTKMGIPDVSVEVGTLPYLEEKYHLSTEHLVEKVKNIVKKLED